MDRRLRLATFLYRRGVRDNSTIQRNDEEDQQLIEVEHQQKHSSRTTTGTSGMYVFRSQLSAWYVYARTQSHVRTVHVGLWHATKNDL